MTEATDYDEIMLAGEYFTAVQGMAMMRHVITDTPRARRRMADVRQIVEHFDEFPQTLEFPVHQYDVDAGYTQWAPSYDGPNPAIAREEPFVEAMLAGIAPGYALDAACGTGRHAATLARLGHKVIGVDATEAMLAVARAKVPGGDFRNGRLEALPVDGESIDVLTCALALTHVEALAPVIAEFARVLRPGGKAILTDIHPFMASTSSVAAFPAPDGKRGVPFVDNRVHNFSEYVQAFVASGLTIAECIEPPVTEEMLPLFPAYAVYPDAVRDAFIDLPYLLIWRLVRG